MLFPSQNMWQSQALSLLDLAYMSINVWRCLSTRSVQIQNGICWLGQIQQQLYPFPFLATITS